MSPRLRSVRRAARGALLLGALTVLGGCRVDSVVSIQVDRDGSGFVSVAVDLDADAAERLGDPARAIRLDDLEAAGWRVVGPTRRGDQTQVAVVKGFGSPGALQAVLDEVGGPDGVFPGWRLDVGDGFSSTTYRLSGRVRLTGSLDQFGDAELAALLDGLPVGRTPEEVRELLGPSADALRLRVRVEVPGGAQDEASFRLGDGRPVERRLGAASRVRDNTPLRWFIVAGGLATAAAVVVVGGRVAASTER